ncbi:HAD family hydrolase [Dyella subtropica]|uniref:HAD family hydrolase n=1 Tax=Dyella subtropica TaxID=2992127 RepID=UPI002B1CB600|nr:HAD family hydrolase [Dyella subtropica]
MPRTVLFDFDGVLFRGDSFGVFMRERFGQSLFRRLMLVPALPWMLVTWPISWRLPIRTAVHIGLLGLSERRYTEAAAAFAASLVRRPGQFSRDGLHALRRHQAAGDRVIVVTGCEQTVVRGILDQLGLDELEVLASELKPGLLGMRVKFHNVGRRKLVKLKAAGVVEWQLAYSDSLQDIPMLKPATEAVLVNGTPKVCKRLEKVLGRTITRVDWF